MFIMMNAARYAVGVQGIAVAERAYQKAAAFAKERVQSRPVDGSMTRQRDHHPPPRRAAHADDDARATPKAAARWRRGRRGLRRRARASRRRGAPAEPGLLRIHGAAGQGLQHRDEPEVASLGVQVHGGMGFIEETGAAQYYRDAKILTIYEGTTAIQANDLVGRKTARDGGQTAQAIARRSRRPRPSWRERGSAAARAMAKRLTAAPRGLRRRGRLRRGADARLSPNAAFAGSVPYLMLAGNLIAGWQMARSLMVAEDLARRGRGHGLHGRPRSPPRASTPSTS